MTSAVPPDVDRSLVDNFERQVVRVPDRVAVGDAARALTYAELDREASRVAGALLAVSAERGETVGLLLGTRQR
jgi:non-ribosomal peptide synthetase component F